MVVPQSPQGAVGDAQTGHHHHDGGDESLQLELENLSNEELVGVYQESNCIECLDILVRRNEGLLHHVIKRFAYSSEPYEDLFQVARIGLLKAAQRYDPTRADSFATYASALVDGEVRHHLRDNLLVRIPRWAKSIYVRIMRTQQEYFQREGRSPTIAEIAQETNIQEEGILEILRVYGATISIRWMSRSPTGLRIFLQTEISSDPSARRHLAFRLKIGLLCMSRWRSYLACRESSSISCSSENSLKKKRALNWG